MSLRPFLHTIRLEGGNTLDQTFFLAANSGQGFYSLYDGFPGASAFLHIIKGGPGTGKSGFMKRIRRAAQERGLDTESIPCSGDPDSLDGLLIPALHRAWVDGTAPHVREPGLFGADSDYVNLGQFCRLPLAERDRAKAQALNREYKALYKTAYEHLAAAAALEKAEELHDAAVAREELQRVRTILDALPDRAGECIKQRRFLSAISCRGMLRMNKTVNLLCKQIYYLRGHAVLEQAAKMAERKAERLILCPRPLRPEQLEAVLLPEQGIALMRAPAAVRVPQGEHLQSDRALARAMDDLREAKLLHDKLEAVYRPYMDFDALTAYTDAYIEKLFS